MADSRRGSRAARVGISCATGIAVPAAAFVATMPFEGVHEAVAANVVPFAVGSVAGAGILTAVSGIADWRQRRREEDEARPSGSRYSDAVRMKPLPKDVPVIARAHDALSEEEAWAEIDATFTDGSPISCDATRSKDIYQIALEELQRSSSAHAAAPAGDAAEASSSAQPAAGEPGVVTASMLRQSLADTTAAYMALRNEGAATTASLSASDDATSATTVSLDEDDTEAARQALASLDSFEDSGALGAPSVSAAGITTKATTGVVPVAPVQASLSRGVAAPRPSSTGSMGVAPARTDMRADEPDDDIEVPMVDYSGHEGMWAQALAILEEPVQEEAPAYVPKHFRGASSSTSTRAAAIAEGDRETRIHSHVNELLEQELDRASSQSVRRTSREYLRVIQGGTASFPRQQAEG